MLRTRRLDLGAAALSALLACCGGESEPSVQQACSGAADCAPGLTVDLIGVIAEVGPGDLTICYTYYGETEPCTVVHVQAAGCGISIESGQLEPTDEPCEVVGDDHLRITLSLPQPDLEGVTGVFVTFEYSTGPGGGGFGAERAVGLFPRYPSACGASCERGAVTLDFTQGG